MLEIAAAARDRSAGHPLWHLLIVAGGAIAVFVAIKVKEHWDRNQRLRLPPLTISVVALALLSLAAGAIHASVSAEHFREAFVFGAFFLAASTAQAGWAVLVVARPNRTVLVAGVVGNAAVIILWMLTRTVGVPIGPEPWQPEAVGRLDVISTLLELALVIGAARLLARTAGFTASARSDEGLARSAAHTGRSRTSSADPRVIDARAHSQA
jgi:hypothetical protein